MRFAFRPGLAVLAIATLGLSLPGAAQAAQHATDASPAPRVYNGGDGVTPPVPTHIVDPEYTQEALKAKYQGFCLVLLVVDEHGMPTDVHETKPIGMGLDEKAIEAVKQYRFKPGRYGGKPVRVRITVEVNFRLPR